MMQTALGYTFGMSDLVNFLISFECLVEQKAKASYKHILHDGVACMHLLIVTRPEGYFSVILQHYPIRY